MPRPRFAFSTVKFFPLSLFYGTPKSRTSPASQPLTPTKIPTFPAKTDQKTPQRTPQHPIQAQIISISPLMSCKSSTHCSLLTAHCSLKKNSPLPQFFLAAAPDSLFPVLETCESTDAKCLAAMPPTDHPGDSPTNKYLDQKTQSPNSKT